MKMMMIAFLGLLLLGCSEKSVTSKKKPPLPVHTIAAEKINFKHSLFLTGEVVAPRTVTLSANVDGRIACCFWRENDRLEENQTVFKIEREITALEVDIAKKGYYLAAARSADVKAGFRPEDVRKMEQEVEAARERLDFLKKDYDRLKQLLSSGSISQETLEKAKVELVAAQTRFDTAQSQLQIGRTGATDTQRAIAEAAEQEAYSRLQLARGKFQENLVRAPFSGTVMRVLVKPGDNAAAKAPLLVLADTTQLVVRFSVPERQSTLVAVKQKLQIELDAFPRKTFPGEVVRVFPELDPKSHVLWVEGVLTESVTLIPGMFARVRLILNEIPGQVVVPESAVFSQGSDSFVFIVSEGKTKKVQIVKGMVSERKVQILSGLSGGEQVISENADQFKDGQAVEVIEPTGDKKGKQNPAKSNEMRP